MRRVLTPLVLLSFVAGAAACDRGGGDDEIGDRDTLAIEVPADVDERMEQGARAVGGAVGEALEETGEAIESAGERIRQETGESVTGDTTRM